MTGCVVFALCVAVADPYTDLFTQAARAYDTQQYTLAVRNYEQLIREDVVDSAVFYNLGNAYYRAGRLGPAIANYERALQVDPGHQAARENLSRALQEIRRNLGRPQPSEWETSLLFWHYGLTLPASIWLAVLCWWCFWLLLAWRALRPAPYVRAAAVGMAVLTCAFAASAWYKLHPSLLGVTSEEVVTVRYLPDEVEPARFDLYEGDHVRIEDEREGWYLVETASGERGWAAAANITLVGPPYTPFPGLNAMENEETTSVDTLES